MDAGDAEEFWLDPEPEEEETEEADWLDEIEVEDALEFPPGYNRYGHEGLCSFDQAFAEAWQVFRVKDPMNFPDWADKNYYLAPDSSGLAGPWVTAPFQRGIMLLMGSDAVRTVAIQKPARVGYTKMLSAFVVFQLERKQRNICVWQPTQTDSDGYVQDEVDPLFEFVDVFRDALMVDYRKDKDPRNTNTRKQFKAAVGHFRPGKSANNYRRITLDTGVLDELDAFDHNIKGSDGKTEGSPVELASVRVTASAFKKMIYGSTPTIKGASLIETEIQHAQEVLERYVPCLDCGHYQTLEWGGPDAIHGIKWNDRDAKSATYMCRACGHHHEWADIGEMDAQGYWASLGVRMDEHANEGDGAFYSTSTGEEVPWPEHVGIMFNTLVSPFYTWSEMVYDFLKATDAVKLGDHTKLQTFYNTRLGLCFELHASEKIDPTTFLSRREYYDAEVPLQVIAMTAGVDIQGDRIEVEFKGWGYGEECWAIKYQIIVGNTAIMPQLDENGIKVPGSPDTVWCKLDKLLRRQFQHESGAMMGISMACIDSGHNTTQVYAFCKRNPTLYIPVKGGSQGYSVPMVTFPAKRNTSGVFLTIVGGDNLQDSLHGRYKTVDDGPGKMHWPIRARPGDTEEVREDFGLTYFTQMLAETRIKRISKGRAVMTWECPPNVSNEATDTNKYALAAIRIAQDFGSVNLNQAPLYYEGAIEDDAVPEIDFAALAARLNRPQTTA